MTMPGSVAPLGPSRPRRIRNSRTPAAVIVARKPETIPSHSRLGIIPPRPSPTTRAYDGPDQYNKKQVCRCHVPLHLKVSLGKRNWSWHARVSASMSERSTHRFPPPWTIEQGGYKERPHAAMGPVAITPYGHSWPSFKLASSASRSCSGNCL